MLLSNLDVRKHYDISHIFQQRRLSRGNFLYLTDKNPRLKSRNYHVEQSKIRHFMPYANVVLQLYSEISGFTEQKKLHLKLIYQFFRYNHQLLKITGVVLDFS